MEQADLDYIQTGDLVLWEQLPEALRDLHESALGHYTFQGSEIVFDCSTGMQLSAAEAGLAGRNCLVGRTDVQSPDGATVVQFDICWPDNKHTGYVIRANIYDLREYQPDIQEYRLEATDQLVRLYDNEIVGYSTAGAVLPGLFDDWFSEAVVEGRFIRIASGKYYQLSTGYGAWGEWYVDLGCVNIDDPEFRAQCAQMTATQRRRAARVAREEKGGYSGPPGDYWP